jgi:phosphoribosyl 1,2-cyclic phosphodiesterase
LTFLGTRGEIEARSRRHRRHSSLLVQRNEARIMIDCGMDWLRRLRRIAPTAIVLTHAHPDHAAGLAEGAPCPVYATRETWDLIHRFPIRDRCRLPLRKSVTIDGVRFKAFPVEHSMRAPAVGYRISANGDCVFYVPDVAGIPDALHVLRGIDVYIGDGATMRRSMVRRERRTVIGHAPISRQLDWCEKVDVARAIFTHCGSPIVRGDARKLNAALRRIGRQHGVEARFACDGDRLSLPDGGYRRR